MQAIAQLFKIALERGARNLQRIQKGLDRDNSPATEHLFDLVEAPGAVNGRLPLD